MTTFRTQREMKSEKLGLHEARNALKRIFMKDLLCEGEDSPAFRKALNLLESHPQLAREWFEATDENVSFRFLPLSIFVASGASVGAVEIVHKLNPKAVSTKHPDLHLYVSIHYSRLTECWHR
jgi:hypothetical protein